MPDRDLEVLLRQLRDTATPPGSETETETNLIARLDRGFSTEDRSLRAGFRNARRAVLAIVAVAGALGGAAATGAVAIAADRAPEPKPSAVSVRAADANASHIPYSAVADSEVRPTGRVKVLLQVVARHFDDIDLDQARGITAPDGTRAWVVTGSAHTCFGAENSDGTGYTCVSNARARRGALSTAAVSDRGRVHAIYLVPDDVSAITAGSSMFRPTNNLVVAEYDEGQPVTIVSAEGATAIPR